MSDCGCGLRGTHYACASCGMHTVTDFEPCPACSYFKFAPVAASVDEPQLQQVTEAAPSAPLAKTKRRQRGAN